MQDPSYDKLPLSWDDYISDSEFGNPDVEYLKDVVRKGVSALPRGLFFTGPSGTGKTSLALLFIRAMRCLDRPDGDINPCGKCAHCTSIDVRLADRDRSFTGVFWLQPGSSTEESMTESFKHAFSEASRGPINSGNPDRSVLFIVVDEFRHVPRPQRVNCLLKTELKIPGNNVCYIFISMDTLELNNEERLAFSRRTREINLRKVSNSTISNYLQHYYSFSPEVSDILSVSCDGRFGMAVALASRCLDYSPSVTPEIASYVSNFPRDCWRWELWSSLKSQLSYKLILDLLKSILDLNISPSLLCTSLIEDIITSISITNKRTEEQSYALTLLTTCLANNSNSLKSYIIQLAGLDLVIQPAVFRHGQDKIMDYIS
jgi:DNA polymerase III delta prime subunit